MITQAPRVAVVASAIPFLSTWLSMLMQPSNVPFDTSSAVSWLEIPHKMRVSHIDNA